MLPTRVILFKKNTSGDSKAELQSRWSWESENSYAASLAAKEMLHVQSLFQMESSVFIQCVLESPGELVKPQIPTHPHPEFWMLEIWGAGISNKPWLRLRAWGPHFENRCPEKPAVKSVILGPVISSSPRGLWSISGASHSPTESESAFQHGPHVICMNFKAWEALP